MNFILDVLPLLFGYSLLASIFFFIFPFFKTIQNIEKQKYFFIILNFILFILLSRFIFLWKQFQNQSIIFYILGGLSFLPIIYYFIPSKETLKIKFFENNLKIQITLLSITQFIIFFIVSSKISKIQSNLSTSQTWIIVLFYSFFISILHLLFISQKNKLEKNILLTRFLKFIGISISLAMGFHLLEDNFSPFPSEHLVLNYTIIGLFIVTIFYFVLEPVNNPINTKSTSKSKINFIIIKTISFLLIFSFGLFLTTSSFRIERKTSKIHNNISHSHLHWNHSLEEAIEEAQNLENKLKNKKVVILVDFWATWCISCKIMARELFQSKEFKTLIEKYPIVLAKVNMTQASNDKRILAQKYGVRGLPTLIFANSNGDGLEKIVGYLGFQKALYVFERIFQKWTTSEAKLQR